MWRQSKHPEHIIYRKVMLPRLLQYARCIYSLQWMNIIYIYRYKETQYFQWDAIARLLSLFSLYCSSNSVQKCANGFDEIRSRFKVICSKRDNDQTFFIFGPIWNFFFHWNPHENLCMAVSKKFWITVLKVNELLVAKKTQV